MSKTVCVYSNSPAVRAVNKEVSKKLGLPNGALIDGDAFVNAIQLFSTKKGSDVEKFIFYRKELLPFLEDYFGMNNKWSLTPEEYEDYNAYIAELKERGALPELIAYKLGERYDKEEPSVITLSNKESYIVYPTIDIIKETSKAASSKVVKNVSTTFETSGATGYAERTAVNAQQSDVTIAIAADFTTAGEKLTAAKAGAKRVAIHIKKGDDINTAELDKVVGIARKLMKPLVINIAGNGLATLSKKENNITQEEANNYTEKALRYLLNNGVQIKLVRSGGQTGFDEAGIIAAQRLGLPSLVYAPKDWKFRDSSGKDITDEKAFKQRFNQNTQNSLQEESSPKDINTISKKTEAFNVVFPSSKTTVALKAEYKQWQKDNPDGIVAYRVNFGKYNTKEEAAAGRIGNPFSEGSMGVNKGKHTVQKFYEWLVTGENFGEEKATESYRQAIIQRILSTPKDAKVLYYTELNRPSHATVLGYLIQNKELLRQSKSSKQATTATRYKVEPIKKTLKDYSEEIDKIVDFFNSQIHRGKGDTAEKREADFLKNHKYYIKKGDRWIEADYSVTSYGVEKQTRTESKLPSTRIGNTFDALVRDYFSTGVKAVYDNLSVRQKRDLVKQLDLFKESLDKQFGKGKYRVITSEFPIGGFVTDETGKKVSVAGTMDMLVIADNGDAYIYDMKTSMKSKEDFEEVANTQYKNQLTFYKRLLGATFPEFASRIKGIGLLVAKTNYPLDSKNYEFNGNEVIYNGKSITEDDSYSINIEVQDAKSKNPYIKSLKYSKAIEGLTMEGLSAEELEALFETTSEAALEQFEEDLEDDAEDFEEEEEDTLGNLTEDVSTDQYIKPVSREEIVFIGRSVVKMASWLCNQLSEGTISCEDLGLDEYFPKGLVGIPGDEIIKMGDPKSLSPRSIVWPKLLDVIRETWFDIMDIDFDDPLFEKYKWINNHFTGIVNGAFAELVDIEGISLTASSDYASVDSDVKGNTEIPKEILEKFDLEGTETDEIEGYYIDSREKSFEASIPTRLKRRLSVIADCALDEDGNIIMDGIAPEFNTDKYGYGIPLFYDKHFIIDSISNNVHYCKTKSEMIAKIDRLAETFAWAKQVSTLLHSNPKLAQDFFISFKKNKSSHTSMYMDKGVLTSAPLETKNKVNVIVDSLIGRFLSESTIPMLFNYNKKNAFGVVSINSDVVGDVRAILKTAQNTRNKSIEERVEAVGDLLDYLGITVVDNLEVFNSTEAEKELNDTVKALSKFINDLTKEKGEFNFNEKFRDNLYSVAKTLAPAVTTESEISVRDGDKSYQKFTDCTYMQTVVEDLSGVDKDRPYILDERSSEYNQYRAFGTTDKKSGERTYINSILSRLARDPESRNFLRYYIRTTVKDKPHNKQGDKLYALAQLIDYFAPTTQNYFVDKDRKDLRLFSVPIMSDKPESGLIQFFAEATIDEGEEDFGLDEMKATIADKNYEFFMYELVRMRSVLQQLKTQSASSDVAEYNIDREKGKELLSKIGKLGIADIVDKDGNLKKYLRTSGMSFHYFPEFNSLLAITDNKGKIVPTKLGKAVIDYINKGDKAIYELSDTLYSLFTTIYNNVMEERYENYRDTLSKLVNNKELDKIIKNEGADHLEAKIQEFFWNTNLRTKEIYNILNVDIAFSKNDISLQKRAAQWHSSTIKADVEATFTDTSGNQQRFSDGNHRFIIIKDQFDDTNLSEIAVNVFREKAKESRAKGDTKAASIYDKLAVTVPAFFERFDSTDGQAYGSATGFWKKYSMLGEGSNELNEALEKIRTGDFDIRNFDICMQPFKPFLFGHLNKANSTELGNEAVPIQVKDSEAIAGALALAVLEGSGKKTALTALYDFMEETHYKAGTRVQDRSVDNYVSNGIDAIVFESAVKVGAFDVLDLNGKSYEEAMKILRTAYSGNPDINGRRSYNESIVKTLPFSCWGKQQHVPPHAQNHEQGMGSQDRIFTSTDIDDDVTETNNPIIVQGKKYGKDTFLKDYFDSIKEDFESGIEIAKRELGLRGKDANKKLSQLLLDSIVKDAKYSNELRLVFESIGRGAPIEILGDPAIADKVYSTIFSVIKRNVNNEKLPGGPIVQVSPYGLSNDLHIRDSAGNPISSKKFDIKKGLIFDCIVTCPTAEMERNITYAANNTKLNKAFSAKVAENPNFKLSREYEDGELLDVRDALSLGLITESELETIAYRIPTEDKYSIYRMRVVKFLPRQGGEVIIMPKELVALSGTDFDIDKMYLMWRYSFGEKEAEKIKNATSKFLSLTKKYNSPNKAFKNMTDGEISFYKMGLKNHIFEMQWGVLGHPSSIDKQVNPGNFKDLIDIRDILDEASGKDPVSLMYPDGQIEMHRKNAAGKEFVGIAALNNVCHGIANLAKISFKPLNFKFILNGVSSNALVDKNGNCAVDLVRSVFTGERISREIGKYVGAAADNAKEAVLGVLNITPTTANIAMCLFRLGFSSKTVAFLMNTPLVKAASEKAENNDKGLRFEGCLVEGFNEICKGRDSDEIRKILETTNITDEGLLDVIEGVEDTNLEIASMGLLVNMIPYAADLAKLNEILSLNSTKNAIGPDIYDTYQKTRRIEEFLTRSEENDTIFSDTVYDIFEKVPFLKPLVECYTKVLPLACRKFSPIYQPSFKTLVDNIGRFTSIGYMDSKSFKNLVNFYLLYKASKLGILDTSEKGRKSLVYDFPVKFFADRALYLKDNSFAQSVINKAISTKDATQTLQFDNVGLGREKTDDLAASWEALLQNSETSKLSNILLQYMLSRFGFHWDPRSAATIATKAVKESLSSSYYNLFVDNGGNIFETADDVISFIYQYARNNPMSSLWREVGPAEVKLQEDGKYHYVGEDSSNVAPFTYLGYRTKDSLYIKDPESSELVPMTTLGAQSKKGTSLFFEVDAASDGVNLDTVFNKENRSRQLEKLRMSRAQISKLNAQQDGLLDEGEDGETGGEVVYGDKKLDTILDVISFLNINQKVADYLDDVLGTGYFDTLTDDEVSNDERKATLQSIYDAVSENKELKKEFPEFYSSIKDIIKKFC